MEPKKKETMSIVDKLNTPLPRSVVEDRPGPGGRKLSYVSGFTVTDYLNRIFGPLNWNFSIEEITRWHSEDGSKFRATVECRGTLDVRDIDRTVKEDSFSYRGDSHREDIGYGHGSGFTLGEAMESAGKEARTDCLKRCAKDFGYALGLALYDKDQKHVKG